VFRLRLKANTPRGYLSARKAHRLDFEFWVATMSGRKVCVHRNGNGSISIDRRTSSEWDQANDSFTLFNTDAVSWRTARTNSAESHEEESPSRLNWHCDHLVSRRNSSSNSSSITINDKEEPRSLRSRALGFAPIVVVRAGGSPRAARSQRVRFPTSPSLVNILSDF